jgi:YARHG domain
MTHRSLAALALLCALAIPMAARADCYDVFGCSNRNLFRMRDLVSGPNCEFLYTMRNAIYAEHGYCFRTKRGIATFGNANCVSSNPEALGLNGVERANAATILKAERQLGCPE